MSFFHDFEESQKMMKIMKKQPTIAHGFQTTYYSMLFFHDFEEFQKTMQIMKKQPTVAHGFQTHTIACVFHDFEGFKKK